MLWLPDAAKRPGGPGRAGGAVASDRRRGHSDCGEWTDRCRRARQAAGERPARSARLGESLALWLAATH
eukprot:16084-Pleurochrysis_carterae.AAC.1